MKNFRRLFSAIVVVVALAVLSLTAQAQTWTKLTNTPPSYLGTALLLTDGTVMVQGQTSNGGGTAKWYRLTPDSTGSYVNGTWTTLASMPSGYDPLYYASAVLADGKVVVVGGEYLGGTESESNEGAIYNPATNTWATITPPTGWTHIGDAASVVLANGTWMIGNCGVAGTECTNQTYQAQLNESALTWTIIGAGNGKADQNSEEGWNLLPNGDVLTVDVWNGKNTEVFNPTTSKWTSAGNTVSSLVDTTCDEIGAAVLSPNGYVFAVGGTANTGIYNIGTGLWTAGPTVPNNYGQEDGPAAILPDGNVLIQVAPAGSATVECYIAPSVFYEFNGTTLTSVPAPTNAANDPSYVGRMLVLPTGQIFWTDGSKTPEIYTAAGTYQSAWQPTISSVSTVLASASTSNAISGTQFNGLSQGGAYGDDAQMATNYPLVRIVNTASGDVVYAKTHNHSTMGVTTGATTVSTEFDIPATIQLGPSELYVVANGIPSAAVSVAIQDATSTAVTANPTSIATTASTTLTATVTDTSNSANTPTGTVTFTDTTNSATLGSCTLASGTCSITGQGSAMAVGSNTISAAYAGVADTYTASSGTTTVTVTSTGDATSTAVTATPNSINGSGSTTLKATVTDTTNGSKIPTGTVTFTDTTNSASLGNCTLASGTCSISAAATSMASGSNTITASYGGVSGSYAASSGTTTVTVGADSTSTSVTATPNSIAPTGSTSLQATVIDTTNGANTPTGTVTFTDTTNSASLGSCTLSAGTCSVTAQGSAMASGSNSISASYAGVSGTYAASSGTTTVTVTTPTGAISFSSVTHNMGSVTIGDSTTYGVTMTNTSSTTVTYTGISLSTTASPNPFSSINNCGTSLAAGAHCNIQFTYAPAAGDSGTETATWSLAGTPGGTTFSPSNGGTLTGTVATSGAVTLTTAGHNFGDQTVGTTSGTYGTVLTNSTNAAITLTLGSVSSPFAGVTNCGSSLAAGQSCNLQFTFSPTADGLVQQVYSLSANGGSTPITAGGNPVTGITLTGTGD